MRFSRAVGTIALLLLSPLAVDAQGLSFSMSTGATLPVGSYGLGAIGRSVSLGLGKRWFDGDHASWRVDLEGYDVLAPDESEGNGLPSRRIQSSGGLAFTWLQGGAASGGSRRYLLYGAAWHYVRGKMLGSNEDGPVVVRFGGGMRRQIGNLPPIRLEVHAMTWLKDVGTSLLIPVTIGMDF